MSETTWDNGPWFVEVRVAYEITGCSSDDAAFWAKKQVMRELDPGMRTEPEVKFLRYNSMLTTMGHDPFEQDRIEDV